MKKLFTMLMVAGMFGLIACGPSAEEKAAAESEAEAVVNEMFEELEEAAEEVSEEVELAAHVCDAKCEEAGCTGPRCGEEGHECSEACHAKAEGHGHAEGEMHEHAEGEEHAH